MSPRLRTIGLPGFVVFVLLLMLSLKAQAAPRPQAAALDVSNQAVVGGGITVASVTAAQDGFVAAFEDDGGAPGDLLGSTAVKKGTNANVKLALTGTVANGAKVWVRLHIDAGTVGKLEFPGADVPAKGADGKDLQKQITIQVAAAAAAATATPAVAATPAAGATTLPNTGDAGGDSAWLIVAGLALLALGATLLLRRPSA